ncbi:MAG: 4-(cytidine 5'-diphospho)-2-C-methyl-D-erythritol kinase [Desulfobacterota bacterium]|nr:4-(cytidine 5'-diphospho)-2-C-methyl-D-erythritol kinase [Thermodesulfobacteriota bacterium]
MTDICVLSPAKINLGLSIIGRRTDGYHEIQTVFQKIALYDEITIKQTDVRGSISLRVSDPSVPDDMSNLAAKAAALLIHEYDIRCGISITINKRIPAGAGLGGGSSNAAATLRAMNTLFMLNLSEVQLKHHARALGADVPFFVTDISTAYGFGIGDQLLPVHMGVPFWTLIVFPNIPIATSWAYEAFSKYNLLTKQKKRISYINSFNTLEDIINNLVNDFELVVFPAYPRIRMLRERLLECGARGALLSGSGSSVFGVFDSYAACRDAYDVFAEEKNSLRFCAQALVQP